MLKGVHHIAIICSNYSISRKFYTEVLKLEILKETYREERKSYKLDLALNGNYIIELFSFENPPKRNSRPEANGLRHLAFSVENLDAAIQKLQSKTIQTEPIRVDPITGKRFTFFEDPDKLPLELYEE
ncbi:SMU1112c/YaeR family gloxylase I-like metalloprotein [Leeuwenhoekiella aequorea]|uniref:Glyoxylase I family protein n=1 Tax=Leeuwenhoekiella aequorea TaxID=283736 RepID=A0A4Q0P2R3_9FLAO|nr:VOC family protein [Leeuwenhoekiella aequorea]RXG20853.1 glyoxylase I family protein [Leeuwenhoekiella aequorea]